MQDLTLVGVHDDGEHLVLTDARGQQYRVRVDESLRAAVRRDRARLGQLQVEADGLRPREIQARIRAGQSAEEVAEAAGIPVEHVRRFEGPVLAEREFVANQARGVRLRRPGTSLTSYALGELVQQRLGQREVDDADTSWDAWREEDGTWVVCLTFHAGSTRRRAHWTYDTQLRHVTARDDEARWFTEEERTEVSASGQRRLTPIRDARDLRDPLRDVVRERPVEAEELRADRFGSGRHSPDRRAADTRHPGERHVAESRYAEDHPEEPYHPDRYENARYGEDRFREDPYREEIYGEDRPAEVRRATIDLLDTLRERRGRRQHLTSADPATAQADAVDAVDAAVETLRTRADALGEPSPGSRQVGRREATPDPDMLRLPDDDVDVIELPDEQEPVPGRPSTGSASSAATVPPATVTPGTTAGADRSPDRADRSPAVDRRTTPERGGATTRTTPERGGAERTGNLERPAARTVSPSRPAASGKRPTERNTDHGQRVTGSRGPTAGTSSGGRGAGGHGGTGRKSPPVGYPSPAAPPAPAPAPARDRQATGPVDEGNGQTERTTPASGRRNKRASVPSWDDIVFGSRRE
jgi:hypothetical protein